LPFGDGDEAEEEEDDVVGFAVFVLVDLAGRIGLAPGAGFRAELAGLLVVLALAVAAFGTCGWYL
jgi:hypothetical protein